jgi:acyl-CoA reductase-like NAD-dependent aldehyde dehydrogenase
MASSLADSGLLQSMVDGRASPSTNRETIAVIDPSSGRLRHHVSAGSAEDADRAVAAARAAFEDGRWAGLSPVARKTVLHAWADRIAADAADLDAMDAGEMGKPVALRQFNAESAAAFARFNAEAVDKVHGELVPTDRYSLCGHRLVPRGVVAAVVPWNFPTFNALLKAAPALAAGNSLVLKPSENASRSALRLAELALEAGLPAGVFNVVVGAGDVVGRGLGLHPDVDMLTFTGSSRVGKLMLGYAGESNMKVVQAECGGKSPHIVFADCPEIDAVCAFIAGFITMNQGQICSIGSRVLVHESIEGAVVERIAGHLGRVVAGNALDPATVFGPLVSQRQLERVLGYFDQARADGIELVVGGHRDNAAGAGYFVRPTLYRGVPWNARIAQEEIFGPVLSVTTFRTVEEAVRLANSTVYGLSAYIWTGDISTGLQAARGVRSSAVVNAGFPKGEGVGPGFSFEPARQSGFGVEGGLAGLKHYSRRQAIAINHSWQSEG